MEIIELKHIAKEYRSDSVVTPALSDIDLSIEKGEFIAIMGASGSGKTTLLNIIGCMDVPTFGTYFFDGVELSREKESDKRIKKRWYYRFVKKKTGSHFRRTETACCDCKSDCLWCRSYSCG